MALGKGQSDSVTLFISISQQTPWDREALGINQRPCPFYCAIVYSQENTDHICVCVCEVG